MALGHIRQGPGAVRTTSSIRRAFRTFYVASIFLGISNVFLLLVQLAGGEHD